MAEVNNQESNVQENEVKRPEKSVEDVQVEQQDAQNEKDNSGVYLALTSIALGLFALFSNIPGIDMVAGFAGIGGAIKAFKPGSRILAAIGFVMAVTGAIFSTVHTLFVRFLQIPPEAIAEWIIGIFF